jgi:polyhydroxyalkanoate synthase subunit PhaC
LADVSQWQAEVERHVRRMQNAAAMASGVRRPGLGQAPRREVAASGKARLYRYEGRRSHETPVLFVPNLGISRPYIFDLLPGASFVEHMTQQGFDFYLLDWGAFGPDDGDLTLEACVTTILPSMAREVLRTSGARELSVLGYCMGAPMSAAFVAAYPEVAVRNLVDMAGPIDFSQSGLFGRWLQRKYFDVDRVVAALGGSIPAHVIRAGFKLIRPTAEASTYLNLWWNLWDERYVEGFTALNTWANEYVALPGAFFRQWVRDFYQDNALYRGELRYGGRAASLSAITCPLLAVGAAQDYIAPPACVRALLDAVGSTDKEYIELPGGHISLIAGRGALHTCWPRVSEWLAARSGRRATGSNRRPTAARHGSTASSRAMAPSRATASSHGGRR